MDEDDGFHCSYHPYRTNNGGICACCLQEKLGKLVSSPTLIPVNGSLSSSYSPPALRSDFVNADIVKSKKSAMVAGAPSVIRGARSTAASSGGNQSTDAGAPAPTTGKRTRFWGFLHITAKKDKNDVVLIESDKPYDRKVSRSRSVGCGSRSFSGDIFERISTGLGDCTLRRVESHREGKSKSNIKDRIKCGKIFNGFIMTSSSSSYVVSSVAEDSNGRSSAAEVSGGRSRSWGWALASPMRAFSKTSSSKEGSAKSKATPNLSAIPSLLTVR